MVNDRKRQALLDGAGAGTVAAAALDAAGFAITGTDVKIPRSSVSMAFTADDAVGRSWMIEVGGSFLSRRGGLCRPDTAVRCLGRLAAVRGRLGPSVNLLVLTTELPEPSHEADQVLRAAGPNLLADVIDVFDEAATDRLARYAAGGAVEPGFWTRADLERIGQTW